MKNHSHTTDIGEKMKPDKKAIKEKDKKREEKQDNKKIIVEEINGSCHCG